MEFPRSFLRRFWRGNQWWRRCSTCTFKGFWVDFWLTCSADLGYFVKSPGWLSCHLITKLILVAFKLRCQDLDKAIAEPRAMERIVFKVRESGFRFFQRNAALILPIQIMQLGNLHGVVFTFGYLIFGTLKRANMASSLNQLNDSHATS